MIEFFKEGGWGMWAILLVGGALIGATARFALRPERRRIGFLGAMGLATVLMTVTALSTDLGMVCYTLARPEKVPDADLVRTLFEGLKESSRPVSFGGMILSVAALLFAAGMARLPSRHDGEGRSEA